MNTKELYLTSFAVKLEGLKPKSLSTLFEACVTFQWILFLNISTLSHLNSTISPLSKSDKSVFCSCNKSFVLFSTSSSDSFFTNNAIKKVTKKPSIVKIKPLIYF